MKNTRFIIVMAALILFIASAAAASGDSSLMEQLRPGSQDVPQGFVIGKIPGFARKVIKGNPWKMDTAAIKKMSPRIYPGANSRAIRSAHMTILAKSKNPYGDDIVCYIFIFTSQDMAAKEIKKLESYTGYNNDRAILLTRGHSAVFLHVDSVEDMPYIRTMATRMKKKMEKLFPNLAMDHR